MRISFLNGLIRSLQCVQDPRICLFVQPFNESLVEMWLPVSRKLASHSNCEYSFVFHRPVCSAKSRFPTELNKIHYVTWWLSRAVDFSLSRLSRNRHSLFPSGCWLPTLHAGGGSPSLAWCLTLLLPFPWQKVHLLSHCITLKVIRRAKFWDCKHSFSFMSTQAFLLHYSESLSVKIHSVQMANKPMKRCSTPYGFTCNLKQKRDTTTQLLARWECETLTPPSVGEEMEPQEPSLVHCWLECRTVQSLLTKLNILPPYSPANVLLGVYPKELKTNTHTETCTWIFIAAVFRIAKTWKQPGCPSVGERIHKLWSIQTIEYHSVWKKKWVIKPWETWRNLKCVLRSERSLSEKAAFCMIPAVWHPGKGKTVEIVKRWGAGLGWGGEVNKQSSEEI